MLQAQTYLMAMNPAADDPRHEFHKNILQGLSLAREELSQKENPRVTLASQIGKPTRQRESASKAVEAASANPSRRSRYEENPREEADRTAARRTRRMEYEDDPKNLCSKIAQNKVDKRRREREKPKDVTPQNQRRKSNLGYHVSPIGSVRPGSRNGSN